jgi:hypothetical protein
MRLSPEDIELFYQLYHPLLCYVNRKLALVRGIDSPRDLKKFPVKEINKLRERLYRQPDLIESFIEENPFSFSSTGLEIIESWTNFVKGTFVIFRCVKDYAIFLDTDEPPKAYGVLALKSTFQEMVGPSLPVMVETVLLPFNSRIIYDGVFVSYPISFGKGVRQSFNDAYQEAKSRFGIITSLPFSAQEVKKNDAEKLQYYLKTERNRSKYSQEIADLVAKDSGLLALYHQEMGKVHARTYGKRLREIGLRDAWFALLQGMIIASGSTKDEIEQILPRIVPAEKRKFVYVFQLKRK